MDGRISSVPQTEQPQTTATLAEVIEFYEPVRRLEVDNIVLINECRAAAQQWLEARGLESEVTTFYDDGRVGVRFSVIIGRQDGRDSPEAIDGTPMWKWSARWTHWADKLGNLRRAAGHSIAHSDGTGAPLIDFGARLAQRDAQAQTGPMAW